MAFIHLLTVKNIFFSKNETIGLSQFDRGAANTNSRFGQSKLDVIDPLDSHWFANVT